MEQEVVDLEQHQSCQVSCPNMSATPTFMSQLPNSSDNKLHEVTRQSQQPLDSGMDALHAESWKPNRPNSSKRAAGLRRRTCSALGAHGRCTSRSSTDVVSMPDRKGLGRISCSDAPPV